MRGRPNRPSCPKCWGQKITPLRQRRRLLKSGDTELRAIVICDDCSHSWASKHPRMLAAVR